MCHFPRFWASYRTSWLNVITFCFSKQPKRPWFGGERVTGIPFWLVIRIKLNGLQLLWLESQRMWAHSEQTRQQHDDDFWHWNVDVGTDHLVLGLVFGWPLVTSSISLWCWLVLNCKLACRSSLRSTHCWGSVALDLHRIQRIKTSISSVGFMTYLPYYGGRACILLIAFSLSAHPFTG